MYDRVTLLYSRHWHNIVSQPYFNLKIQLKQKKKKKKKKKKKIHVQTRRVAADEAVAG